MIGGLNQLEIVLDHEHRVALVHQALEGADQPPDVLHVEPGGGLIKEEERVTVGPPREVRHQLDALRLTARERRRRLPEGQVAEPHIHHQPQRAAQQRVVLEQLVRLLHRHRQHVGDGPLTVAHVEGLLLEAAPAALLAGDRHRAQELQLHHLHARPQALLAASSRDVEAEAGLGVPPHLGLGEAREELADRAEDLGVRGGVRARGPADGRRRDRDHLVDVLEAEHRVVSPRVGRLALEVTEHSPLQGPLHQGGLARAGDPGHSGQGPEGDAGIDPLEVERGGPADLQELSGAGPPILGSRDLDLTAQQPARRSIDA